MTTGTEAILADYERWLRSWGASDKTVSARLKLARNRHSAWGEPAGFTTERLQEFLGNRDFEPWTISTYYANLNDYCSWLYATGRIESNPMVGMKRPRTPHSLPRPLSEAEVQRVLGAATGHTRTWVQLALLAGLRAHEVAKIKGEHVQEDFLYVVGKGSKPAMIPTHPELWRIAQGYPRHGYWFPSKRSALGHVRDSSITTQVGRLFRSLEIEDGSIHRCRHVYGTRLLRAGVNIRQVQRLMRHSSLATTATYTAVDEESLREAINRLSA